MTKFKVYSPQDTEEKTVYLKLEPSGSDSVELYAVDKNGHLRIRGRLLCFEDGRLRLCAGIDPDLGFDLDDIGRIKLIK